MAACVSVVVTRLGETSLYSRVSNGCKIGTVLRSTVQLYYNSTVVLSTSVSVESASDLLFSILMRPDTAYATCTVPGTLTYSVPTDVAAGLRAGGAPVGPGAPTVYMLDGTV